MMLVLLLVIIAFIIGYLIISANKSRNIKTKYYKKLEKWRKGNKK
jgi:hypothetical protein